MQRQFGDNIHYIVREHVCFYCPILFKQYGKKTNPHEARVRARRPWISSNPTKTGGLLHSDETTKGQQAAVYNWLTVSSNATEFGISCNIRRQASLIILAHDGCVISNSSQYKRALTTTTKQRTKIQVLKSQRKTNKHLESNCFRLKSIELRATIWAAIIFNKHIYRHYQARTDSMAFKAIMRCLGGGYSKIPWKSDSKTGRISISGPSKWAKRIAILSVLQPATKTFSCEGVCKHVYKMETEKKGVANQ